MAIEETGPGAGVAAADAEHAQQGLQYAMLQQQGAFRAQELQMKMMEIMHQNAVLNHQTAQQQYEAVHRDGEALRAATSRYAENYPDQIFDPNKPGVQAVIGHVIHHAATEAAAFTNAFGGDPTENLQNALNDYIAPLQATPTKVGQAMTDAIAARTKAEIGLTLKLPQIEGEAKGISTLTEAQDGGSQAAGMTRAAQEQVTPKVLGPDQTLAVPPPGSLSPGQPGPAATGPTSAVVAPPVGGPIPAPAVAPAALPAAPGAMRMPAPAPGGAPAPAAVPAVPPGRAANGVLIPPQMSPAELEAQKGSQQQWQTVRNEFRNANTDADKVLQSIEIMAKAQQLANTGMLASAKVQLQRLVNALGLGDTVNVADVADNQAFNKVAYQVAIGMTHQLSSRPSQLEFTGALQNTPNPEMDPRAASVLMQNMAAAAYHLKDQYAAFEAHGARNAFPSGTPNFEGFDQAWAIPNSLATYGPGGKNYRAAPGTPEANVRMIGFGTDGKPVPPGRNPAYVIEYHREGPGPNDWKPVQTYR